MFQDSTYDASSLSTWNVEKVKYMAYMLANSKVAKYDVSKWNVSNVEMMTGLFMGYPKTCCYMSS